MAEYLIDKAYLVALADAIRKKSGSSSKMTPSAMISAINNLGEMSYTPPSSSVVINKTGELYTIQDTTLNNLANSIRKKGGRTDNMTLEQMVQEILSWKKKVYLKGTATISGVAKTGHTLTVTPNIEQSDAKLGYQWRMYLSRMMNSYDYEIKGATRPTYMVESNTEGYQVYCRINDLSGKYDGFVSSGKTAKVVKDPELDPVSFAIFSADDNSLYFYKRASKDVPTVGSKFNGKTVTDIYKNIEATGNTMTSRWYNHSTKIKTVKFVDEIFPTSTSYFFYNFISVNSMDLSNLNTSRTGSFNGMFMFNKMTSLNLSNLNTSSATNMEQMFRGCDVVSLDISSFNTSKVSNMEYMFDGCSNLNTIHLGSKFSFNGSQSYRQCDLVARLTTWANSASPNERYGGDSVPNNRDVIWKRV